MLLVLLALAAPGWSYTGVDITVETDFNTFSCFKDYGDSFTIIQVNQQKT